MEREDHNNGVAVFDAAVTDVGLMGAYNMIAFWAPYAIKE